MVKPAWSARLNAVNVTIVSVVLAFGTALLTAQSQPSAPQPPTFKSSVEYVEVDAVVTDANGHVPGLTKDDFEVFEDGVAQTVTTFSAVDVPIEIEPGGRFATPAESDVASNERPFDGRVYVMVLDDLHVDALRSQNVKQAARQFIDRYLGANDQMSVIYTGRDGAAQEFTSNRFLLKNAVEQFTGRQLPSPTMVGDNIEKALADIPAGGGLGGGGGGLGGASPGAASSADLYEAELARNAESMLSTLRQVGQWIGAVRGRRKAVLLFSEGLNYDLTNLLNNSFVNGRARTFTAMRDTLAEMTRSNIAIYGLDPRALSATSDDAITVSGFARGSASLSSLRAEERRSQDNLRQLSEDSGGFAAVNRNDTAAVFDRIVRENSSYYVLAYYPSAPKSDGKQHRIEVRVSRPGVAVQARRGYIAEAGPESARPASKADSDDRTEKELEDALKSPLPVSGLTMRLFAAPLKNSKKNASVVVAIELNGRDLTFGGNNKVELSFAATDTQSKVRSARTDTLPLNVDRETRARIERSALRMINRIELPPGRYRLHVAARDPLKHAVGSVFADIDVPDFYKQPLSMSGLMITSLAGSNMVTALMDDQLRTILPSPVVALRTFAQNDELDLFAEVYDDTGKAKHKIDIQTTVLTPDGLQVAQSSQTHDSSELAGSTKALRYKEFIPLSRLVPGDYVLKVEGKSGLSSGTTTSKQVPFRVVQLAR
jgi:VWFA-related protein